MRITIFRFGTLWASLRTRFDLLINDMVLNFLGKKNYL